MSAVVVNIHLGGLVVVQLLPDVGFILQNNYWSDLFKSETCGQKYLSYFCWLYPAKKLMRPLLKADSRWMWSKIFIPKLKKKRKFTFGVSRVHVIRNIYNKQKEKDRVHLWCVPSPCDQKIRKKRKREKKIKREKGVIVHLWCEPSPGLVRPSVVFVARRHFDIVVELDYLQK